ncbi:MAG: aminotransferase class I/II-fold pyridoxal phosphate-dependent enzyme [Acidobacteriales bacterium]|nr:aminotransferase class I/II-fold pyridoxal phosphate-dependent enzyme [Terriglobales bacterium]
MPGMLSRRSFLGYAAAGVAAGATPTLLHGWSPEPRRGKADAENGPIHLNSNENAYGAFPSVIALPNPFLDANRYPFRADEQLAESIAAKHKVKPEQVLLGCGSTETIKTAVAAFTSPSRKLVMAAPTFEAAEMHARANGAPVEHVPLTANYAHDLDAMLKAAEGAGLVYICNPNNPTASLTPRSDLEKFVASLPQDTAVLMDEAYHDFVPAGANYRSFLDSPVGSPQLIVARTFSKIYGMAGLRLGYGIASPDMIERMRNQSQSDSINIFAIRCALAALADETAHAHAVARNATDRSEFMKQCAARNVTAIPSATNFVMIETGHPVRKVIEHFRTHNVLVGRPFPPYDTKLRVSLGRPAEMQSFWRAWDALS